MAEEEVGGAAGAPAPVGRPAGGEALRGCPFSKAEELRTLSQQEPSSAAGKCPFLMASSSSSDRKGPSSPFTHLQCPLGFSSSKPSASSRAVLNLPIITREELQTRPGLIAVKGVVYDTRNVGGVAGDGDGGPLASILNHDVSRNLALGSLSSEHLDAGLAGLTYDQHCELEKWAAEMDELFSRVGLLQSTKSNAPEQLVANEDAFRCIERGDEKGLEALLNAGVSLAATCPRTGMGLLHKAVEAGSLDMVHILMQAGADRSAKCDLYDGDTPAELAQRLRMPEISALFDSRVDAD
jgi:hypothetical protein